MSLSCSFQGRLADIKQFHSVISVPDSVLIHCFLMMLCIPHDEDLSLRPTDSHYVNINGYVALLTYFSPSYHWLLITTNSENIYATDIQSFLRPSPRK